MLKKIWAIIKNRFKVQGVEFLIELLISIMSEIQRTDLRGHLDVDANPEVKQDVFQDDLTSNKILKL